MAIHNSIRAIASRAQLRVGGGVVSEESRFQSLEFFMDKVRGVIPIAVYNYAKDFESRQRANRLIAEKDVFPASLYRTVCCIPVTCRDLGCDVSDVPSDVKEYSAVLPFMPHSKLGNKAIKYIGSEDRCNEISLVGRASKGKPLYAKKQAQARFEVRNGTPILVLTDIGDVEFICIEAIPQDPTAVGVSIGPCGEDAALGIPQEVIHMIEDMVVNTVVPQVNVKPQVNNTNTNDT